MERRDYLDDTEWEVWLYDGSTRNSRDHNWEDLPDDPERGVLVLKWWDSRNKGL